MGLRHFKLPDIDDLTKEQDAIIDLPLEGQHLVVGGPGTGKSVVALMRARRLARENTNYKCLAFNHTLLKSNEQLFGEGLHNIQWQKWFHQVYKQAFSASAPMLENDKGIKSIDWQQVITNTTQRLNQSEETDEHTYLSSLIIDEGQDMPPQFYEALVNLFFEDFFVVADQNQQINENCSSIKELQTIMGLEPDEVHILTQNWRNTYQIAKLSRVFYVDKATPPPALPDEEDRYGDTPCLYTYRESHFNNLIEVIMVQAKDYKDKLIGIICPNNIVFDKYLNEIHRQKTTDPRFSEVRISYYRHSSPMSLDFTHGGISIINAQSCKGLEFDTVFLADINEHKNFNHEPDFIKKRFYVMASRARERLFLLRQEQSNNPLVDSLLPDDTSILTRHQSWK